MVGFLSVISFGVGRRHRPPVRAGVIVNEHTLSGPATRHHVEVLGRSFELIHHDDLLDRIERPRRRPFCLLTFDDGKRSNYTQTARELERLGMPAVFYVTTQFLADGIPLWFDRYEALVAALGHPPAGLEPATIKLLPLAAIEERMDRACAEHGVSLDLHGDTIQPMSWDDARDLARRGFTIGAHSRRHAVLTCEAEDEARQDIEQSIAAVSAEIGAPCPTFAFPNGNYTHALARHALDCGVRTVMTTDPTWVDARFPAWRLPRLELSEQQSRFKIELKLAVATAGRLLRNPDGTGRYRRTDARTSDRTRPRRPPATSTW
jgi:peptidoglycan/xylan/chitin deacetylase (PgdA/CDA1 family)